MKLFAAVLLLFAPTVFAGAWHFDAPIDVSVNQGARVFHHLESAGRRSVAVSGGQVVVTWEDNRTGEPAVYAAFKPDKAAAFTGETRLSHATAGYEPVVVALGGGQVLFAWEEDNRVWLQLATDGKLAGSPRAGPAGTRQASLAASGDAVWLAWSRQRGKRKRVEASRVVLAQGKLELGKALPLDSANDGDQTYPSIAITRAGQVMAAWEDRRAGHTRIYFTAQGNDGRFQSSRPVNTVRRSQNLYGRGPGAARVVLAPVGDGMGAVWLDKRDFRSGYDVYVAIDQRGTGRFGANEKAQDSFGDTFSQWHASLAPGDVPLAVWDDDRDETADLFISARDAAGWSEDVAVPGASGPGEQREPSITADAAGNYHLVWVEQDSPDSGTRLRYLKFNRR